MLQNGNQNMCESSVGYLPFGRIALAIFAAIVFLPLGGCATKRTLLPQYTYSATTDEHGFQSACLDKYQDEPLVIKGGKFKLGARYKIKGRSYRPVANYNYNQVGYASWYGKDFHGKITANGEIFNMNAVSAAHRTLPLPCVVRVTNLKNKKSLIVRVHDRGPYTKNRKRIIDLSKKAAELLGFKKEGIAKVRVQILPQESRALARGAEYVFIDRRKDSKGGPTYLFADNSKPGKSAIG